MLYQKERSLSIDDNDGCLQKIVRNFYSVAGINNTYLYLQINC